MRQFYRGLSLAAALMAIALVGAAMPLAGCLSTRAAELVKGEELRLGESHDGEGRPTAAAELGRGEETRLGESHDGGDDADRGLAERAVAMLQRRCVECHGPPEPKGELRLDQPAGIAAGGHTGGAIVGPDGGELLRRLTSDDPDFRMPREGELLTAAEIDLLRQWSQAGGPWPAPSPPEALAWWEQLLLRADPLLTRFERLYRVFWPLALIGIGLLACVAHIERCKRRAARGGAVSAASRVSRFHYLWMVATVTIAALWLAARNELAESQASVARLRESARAQSVLSIPPLTRTAAGGPVPPRPKHPPRLGGVYYRGNDERHPRLYNGGYYRTAVFTLSLLDENGQPLVGDAAAPTGPLAVGLTIDRARDSTPALFTDAVMRTIYLSRQIPLRPTPELEGPPVRLTEVTDGEQWTAQYPIGVLPADGERLSGMIYIYKGRREDDLNGKYHYGIAYDIAARDGRIAAESEIWMGPLSVPFSTLLPPPRGMPATEWFDFRPIPEIEGKNTDDPALLGIPEFTGSDVVPPPEPTPSKLPD